MEANRGRSNYRDRFGETPLIAATSLPGLPLVVWLLDEKGADVNGTTGNGRSALHYVAPVDILIALLDRGADPIVADRNGGLPLIRHAVFASVDTVARMLHDPRVRATINAQRRGGNIALLYACRTFNNEEGETAALTVHLLLQAGTDPTITNENGQTPLDVARHPHPTHHAAIALLEQALAEAGKASLLVKARRLAVAATSNAVVPSCLLIRVAQGQPLPRIALALPRGQQYGENKDEGEESRKFRTTLAFMCGLGRGGMPRDVFRVVMDLLDAFLEPA